MKQPNTILINTRGKRPILQSVFIPNNTVIIGGKLKQDK